MRRFRVKAYLFVDADHEAHAEDVAEEMVRDSGIRMVAGMDAVIIRNGSAKLAEKKEAQDERGHR
jgi:hypothetical protein